MIKLIDTGSDGSLNYLGQTLSIWEAKVLRAIRSYELLEDVNPQYPPLFLHVPVHNKPSLHAPLKSFVNGAIGAGLNSAGFFSPSKANLRNAP